MERKTVWVGPIMPAWLIPNKNLWKLKISEEKLLNLFLYLFLYWTGRPLYHMRQWVKMSKYQMRVIIFQELVNLLQEKTNIMFVERNFFIFPLLTLVICC